MEKPKPSFTLTELIIAVGIFSMFSAIVFGVITTGRMSWAHISAKLYLQQQARTALARINRDLLMSETSRVFITDNGQKITFKIPCVKANGDLDYDAFGDLRWGDGSTEGNSIRYCLKADSGKEFLFRQILDNAGTIVRETKITFYDTDFLAKVLSSGRYFIEVSLATEMYSGKSLPQAISYALSSETVLRN